MHGSSRKVRLSAAQAGSRLVVLANREGYITYEYIETHVKGPHTTDLEAIHSPPDSEQQWRFPLIVKVCSRNVGGLKDRRS